jgi:hypothetical protein
MFCPPQATRRTRERTRPSLPESFSMIFGLHEDSDRTREGLGIP